MRATENFYSALHSATYIINEVENAEVPPELQSILDSEHEYSALGGRRIIKKKNALEYTSDAMGNVRPGQLLVNPAYESIETHASGIVYEESHDETGKSANFPVKKAVGTNHSAGFSSAEQGCSTWSTTSVLSLGLPPPKDL